MNYLSILKKRKKIRILRYKKCLDIIIMDDQQRSLELNSELQKLDNELNEYCWNVNELTISDRQDIKELYRLWKSCLNKKIIIQNIKKGNIRVSDKITVDGNIIWNDIRKHHTLHFINCTKSTIVISEKVNHITLERCSNVNIRSTGGSISGIDTLKCNNVTHIFETGNIYFIDISNSTECEFMLSETIAKDVLITTQGSYNINFRILCRNSGVIKNKYKTSMNIFLSFSIYYFRNNEIGELALYIFNPASNKMNPINPH